MLQLLQRGDGETAHCYARRVLLYNIINFELKPGDRIREAELCAQLQLSRTPVREGILDLAQYRLIELYPQSGTYVSKIDPEYVESARYLRQILEADLTRSACDCCGTIQLAILKENLRQQRNLAQSSDKEKEFLQLDIEFHYTLYEICGRRVLFERLKDLCVHLDRARVLSFHGKVSEKILCDHEDIVCAIESKNKEAAYRAAYQHLEREIEEEPILCKKFPHYYKD